MNVIDKKKNLKINFTFIVMQADFLKLLCKFLQSLKKKVFIQLYLGTLSILTNASRVILLPTEFL